MSIKQNFVCVVLASGFLLSGSCPARAGGDLMASVAEAMGTLAWETLKGGAECLGGYLIKKAGDWWDSDTGVIKNPEEVDEKLKQLQAGLLATHEKRLADAVAKLRTEITPNMKVEEYYQKVIKDMAEIDRRLGKVEEQGNQAKQNIKDLYDRLSKLEQRDSQREEQTQHQLAAEKRLRDRKLVERSLTSLRTAKSLSQREAFELAAAELTKTLEPIYQVKKSFVEDELNDDMKAAMGYIFMARGDTYVKLDLNELAVTDYTAASMLASDKIQRSRCFEVRGDLLLRLAKPEHAIEDYTKSIELKPSTPVLYGKRAKAYRELGEDQLAERDERAARAR